MKFARVLIAAIAVAAVHLASAQMSTPMNTPSAASAPGATLAQGEVRKVDVDKGTVVLRHGDIPSLAMPPMTMAFDVADRKMLEGLNVGDKVQFQAEMVKGRATVTQLKRP